jgi:FHS family glucose/mannose:H+ symporter-like MFS transporter
MIWPLIIISYLSLFVFGITDNVRGPLFPEILKDFHVSDSLGSLMFSLSSLSGFLVSFLVIYLVRFYDRRKILQFSSLGFFLVLIGLGLTHHFNFFLILNILFGIFSGIIGLIPNVLVPLGSTNEKKQQLMSGLHAMYCISSLIAPLIVAFVNFKTNNWRNSFLFVSLAPFCLFFYSFHKSHLPHHQKSALTKEDRRANSKKNLRPQLFLAFMLSFCVICEVMLSSRLALFMERIHNASIESASFYVSYFFMALLAGRLLFAFIKLPIKLKNQLNLCGGLTILNIFLGLKFHPLFLVLAGFTVAPFYPLTMSLVSNEFPHDLDNAIAFILAVDSMMLSLMHVYIGKMTDHFNIQLAMFSGLFFLMISLFLNNSYEFFFKNRK